MRVCLKNLVLVLAIVWFAGSPSFAEGPAGTFQITGADLNAKVWDFSGAYTQSAAGVLATFTLVAAPSGWITGAGTASFHGIVEGHQVDFDIPLTVTGRSSAPKGEVRMKLLLALEGTGTVDGDPATLSGTLSESLTLDEPARTLSGPASGTVKITSGLMTQLVRVNGGTQATLPEDVTGEWNAMFTLETSGVEVTGAGSLHSNVSGTVQETPLEATGKYSASAESTTVRLSGPGCFIRFKASTASGGLEFTELKAKLFGQRLAVP